MLTKQVYKLATPAQGRPTFCNNELRGNTFLPLASPGLAHITIPNIYNFSYFKFNTYVTKVTRRRPKLETVECLYPPK